MTSTLVNKTGALEFLGALQLISEKNQLPPQFVLIKNQLEQIKQKAINAGLGDQVKNLTVIDTQDPELSQIASQLKQIYTLVKDKFKIDNKEVTQYMEVKGYQDQKKKIITENESQKFDICSQTIINLITSQTPQQIDVSQSQSFGQTSSPIQVETTSQKSKDSSVKQEQIETTSQKSKTPSFKQEQVETQSSQSKKVVLQYPTLDLSAKDLLQKLNLDTMPERVAKLPKSQNLIISKQRVELIKQNRQNIIIYVKVFILMTSQHLTHKVPITTILDEFNKTTFGIDQTNKAHHLTMAELNQIINTDEIINYMVDQNGFLKNRRCVEYENILRSLEKYVEQLFKEGNYESNKQGELWDYLNRYLEVQNGYFQQKSINQFGQFYIQLMGESEKSQTEAGYILGVLQKLRNLNVDDRCQQELKQKLRYFIDYANRPISTPTPTKESVRQSQQLETISSISGDTQKVSIQQQRIQQQTPTEYSYGKTSKSQSVQSVLKE